MAFIRNTQFTDDYGTVHDTQYTGIFQSPRINEDTKSFSFKWDWYATKQARDNGLGPMYYIIFSNDEYSDAVFDTYFSTTALSAEGMNPRKACYLYMLYRMQSEHKPISLADFGNCVSDE